MATAKKHNDKPLGNIKRINVGNEVNPDPAQYPLKDGHLVTFPDIFDLDLEAADRFMVQMEHANRTGRVVPVLKSWLSEEDYTRLIAEYPTTRKVKPIVEAVLHHYQGVWGSEGEGNASEG